MSKASPGITALNAGEWSPLLSGRTDLQGYSASAYVCENFLPTVQGPIIRRAGSGFINQTKETGAWLVPFIKSRDDAMMIEFGNLYCRFFVNRSPVVTGVPKTITAVTAAQPPVVTSAAHGYSNGDDVFISGVTGMTPLNGRWFKAANVAANTFELQTIHGIDVDGTAYPAYVSGGTADKPYQIVSPYSTANLVTAKGEFGLDFVQTGDVIYVTHRAGTVAPKKLSRTSATSIAFAELQPSNGPWLALNAGATTMYVSAATGSITITASTSVFTANDIGSLIRIDQEILSDTENWKTATAYAVNDYVRSEGHQYQATNAATSGTSIPSHTRGVVSDGAVKWRYQSSGYGIARITAQGGTTATATVLTRFPQTLIGVANASLFWRKGAWSIANGYPTAVTFFRERLAFGQKQRVDLSVAASFEDFSVDSFGEVLAESAVSVTVQSSQANDITGLTEGQVLVVNTEGAEFTIDAPATGEPFGPNNVRVSRQHGYGARPIRPIKVGPVVMFVQASGRKLRAMEYALATDNFIAPDMTIRSEHLPRPSITAMVRQDEPYAMFWCVRSDGVLLSFTYDQENEARAWARHDLGTVEAVAVIPSPAEDRDEVWVIVSREINGGTRRYIEYLRAEYLDEDQEDATYGDSGLTYDGSAATTLYGFDHLEGQTVGLLSDGAAVPDETVFNGQITIASASVVQVGLRYASTYATQNIEAGAGDGTAQGKIKRLTDVAFRVISTRGGQAGPDMDTLDDILDLNYVDPATPMGTAPPLITNDALVSWPGGYETAGRIWYQNDSMFPATIAAILPQVVTQESR